MTADEYARWVRWTPKPAELRRPLESYFICGTPVAGRPHEWFWRDTRTSLKRAWGVDDADEYLELG